MSCIKGKKILLMMPFFYDLHTIIYDELTAQGATVSIVRSYIFKEAFMHNMNLISFVSFLLNPFYKEKYTKKIIEDFSEVSFDIFFVVGIFSSSNSLLAHLKAKNKNLKTYIYLWDAFSSWDFSKSVPLFDYKFSFDRLDCLNHLHMNLTYLPLFYSKSSFTNEFTKYDISHIGTLGPKYNDRIFVLDSIYKQAQYYGLRTYIRAYAASLNSSFFKKKLLKTIIKDRFTFLFDSAFRKHIKELKKYKESGFIHNTILSPDIALKIELESKCILDVNIDNAGIAYRIIKALANGNKVITTNKHIKDESFYSSDNICIIDKNNPVLDVEFLKAPARKLDLFHLRIDNWINTIFNED
jgi:hypothetical protein